jgi:hypothetical protein
MEGLRDSKLEEGQQWGKNTSSKDRVQWGRRPPFIGPHESARYVQKTVGPVQPVHEPVQPVKAEEKPTCRKKA